MWDRERRQSPTPSLHQCSETARASCKNEDQLAIAQRSSSCYWLNYQRTIWTSGLYFPVHYTGECWQFDFWFVRALSGQRIQWRRWVCHTSDWQHCSWQEWHCPTSLLPGCASWMWHTSETFQVQHLSLYYNIVTPQHTLFTSPGELACVWDTSNAISLLQCYQRIAAHSYLVSLPVSQAFWEIASSHSLEDLMLAAQIEIITMICIADYLQHAD